MLVIHGHFYQPPRENPALDIIEYQPSAAPFHDWNERITLECYGPNTRSRIISEVGKISSIVNNFEYLSFNIGPTLINYLRKYYKDIYNKIIEADKKSMDRLGSGNAIAQIYNHIIMPLADEEDKETQVYWGIEDFRFHFNRDPESIWLSETAVNYDTLNVLHKFGIKFVILSPFQAERIRELEGEMWEDVSNGNVDTSLPYRIFLKDEDGEKIEDKYIDAFFYDGDLSQAVAFEGLLKSADVFAEKIIKKSDYYKSKEMDYLISIVTDGESYGHHEKFGDMCLSSLFKNKLKDINITNFSAYLKKNPPKFEAELKAGKDNLGTAWSCAHGVERWRSDCGCSTGGEPGWNQKWRRPLRKGFDDLNRKLRKVYKKEAAKLFYDPMQARNNYIEVILSPEYRDKFLKYEMLEEKYKDRDSRTTALSLLESQKYAMMMFTSCGWFFSDISGIETVQDMKYAVKAVNIISSIIDTEKYIYSLKSKLKKAKSNIEEIGDGSWIIDNFVLPSEFSTAKRIAVRLLKAVVFNEDKWEGIQYSDNIKFEIKDKYNKDEFYFCIYEGVLTETKVDKDYNFIVAGYNNKGYNPGCYIWEIKNNDIEKKTIKSIFEKVKNEKYSLYQALEEIGNIAQPETFTISNIPYDSKNELFSEMLKNVEKNISADFNRLYEENKIITKFCRKESILLPEFLKLPITFTLSNKIISILENIADNFENNYIEKFSELIKESMELKIDLFIKDSEELYQNIIMQKLELIKKEQDADILNKLEMFIAAGRKIFWSEKYFKVQDAVYEILLSNIFNTDINPVETAIFYRISELIGLDVSRLT